MTSLEPGQQIRPSVSANGAILLVERLYGVKVHAIKELNSYDDRNFMVTLSSTTPESHVTRHGGSDKYTLKILNSLDSQKNHVDAEHVVMRILKRSSFPCPLPVANLSGNDQSLEYLYGDGEKEEANNSSQGTAYLVRLLTFIPGQLLADVTYTPDLLYKSGKFIGGVTKALLGEIHPALDGHKTMWSLDSVPKLKDFVYAVDDVEGQELVKQVIAAFSEKVLAQTDFLDKGIIHGDYNEQNILVSEAISDTQCHEIVGLIDFGDMQYSCYIYEVAITIMYMMVGSTVVDELEVGGHVLAGYLSERIMSPAEWDVLHTCVAARYAQSLVMGIYTYKQDPGNEYLLITAKRGWPQLKKLWETPSDELYQKWRKVIKQYEHRK